MRPFLALQQADDKFFPPVLLNLLHSPLQANSHQPAKRPIKTPSIKASHSI